MAPQIGDYGFQLQICLSMYDLLVDTMRYPYSHQRIWTS